MNITTNKLLVFTQKVDKNDPILGFFHGWIIKFAGKFDSITVVCLEVGELDLPANVKVYSLGKEFGVKTKISYIRNFFNILKLIKGQYCKVFVHMNQEYVLLGGLYWKAKSIPVYMWRNHPSGSFLTRIAVALSTKVFCTSTSSFTAKYKKTVLMSAGVDTDLFQPVVGISQQKYSVCMVGRISPIKRVDLAIKSVENLIKNGSQVSLHIHGPVAEVDQNYFQSLKDYVVKNNLDNFVFFKPAVTQTELPKLFSSYELFVNLTPAGSFDKTIVEACACGLIPVVSNESLTEALPRPCITTGEVVDVSTKLLFLLEPKEQIKIQDDLAQFVKNNSLSKLLDGLLSEIE